MTLLISNGGVYTIAVDLLSGRLGHSGTEAEGDEQREECSQKLEEAGGSIDGAHGDRFFYSGVKKRAKSDYR